MLVASIAAVPPLPLAAASGTTPASPKPPTSIRAAVHQAAVKDSTLVVPARSGAARRADQSGPSKQSSGFFRSGAGAVALAVMAVGAGYAIYSASHDKINSPGKK